MSFSKGSPQNSESRVWLITGASRGLGLAFTQAALATGDSVVAFSRTPAALDQLTTEYSERLVSSAVDVTDRLAVQAAVKQAVERFGRLDIVVNNAGNLTLGMVEEFSEAQARAQFETNFFGALWVSQAVLPVLRQQQSGHLIQISSIGALAGFPMNGLYSASKAALESLSESLAIETSGFGVKVTIVEPGGYWTDLYNQMATTDTLSEYADLRAEMEKTWAEGSVDSEPRLAAEALLKLVNSPEPPLRLLLGSMIYDLARDLTQKRLDTWAEWETVSRAAELAVPQPSGQT